MNMFHDTVTVYNRYHSDGGEKWHRTVVRGVYMDIIKGAIARKTAVSGTDSAVLIIPMNIPPCTEFVNPASYSGTGWTLKAGDYIAYGEILHDITVSPKELRGICDSYVITAVDRKYHGGPMAHWEVTAK